MSKRNRVDVKCLKRQIVRCRPSLLKHKGPTCPSVSLSSQVFVRKKSCLRKVAYSAALIPLHH